MSFPVSLEPTTELLGRFHRTLMDRRQDPLFESFDSRAYPPDLVAEAGRQWASRAKAEYLSTAQFGQLLHRLTLVGAPLELIGAATRLAQDECRHAELCEQMARVLGTSGEVPSQGLSLFEQEDDDPWLTIYRTILSVCCFGETISVPMLQALTMVATDPTAKVVARIISGDEEYHARYGWEALRWLTPRLDASQRAFIQGRLPVLMGHFEKTCGGSRQMLEVLAGQDVEIEEADPNDPPNLGTMTKEQYAAIFYHTMEAEILPRLQELGYDAVGAWSRRTVS